MNRKIITAVAGMSLFGGLAMTAAAAPAAATLAPTAALDADASAATAEKVAYLGLPAVNTATSTQIGLGGIAIGTQGSVSQSAVNQAGGFGNVGVATANAATGARAAGFGRGGFGRGHGGWGRVAMADEQSAARSDVLFDN
jgi:hypothetical protein